MKSKRVWNVGVKVGDLEDELERCRRIGVPEVLREVATIAGQEYDLALLRIGDKYVIMAEEFPYEASLDQPLEPGCTHVVYSVEDFEHEVERAVAAGAQMIGETVESETGFGRRKVAVLRSPGGMIFEYIDIISNLVPEV